MKKLILLSTFFFSISIQALPLCPSDTSVRWDDCFGTYTFANGDKYVGEFKEDKIHGQGTYTYANGGKYIGEYKDDKRHGQGTYTFTDGGKYVGEYKDGKKHGLGTYTFASGRKEFGFFMNGEFVPDICGNMGLSLIHI